MYGERCELADAFRGECVKRGAADDVIIVLGNDEPLDLAFEALSRATDEHALLLERLDDTEDAADVVNRRVAQMCERRRGDHRADAVAGEKLEQQRTVVMAADEMRARDTVVTRTNRGGQVDADVRRQAVGAG